MFPEFAIGPFGKNETGFPVQPIGGPVGCNVATLAPDGADLHAAERLPDILLADVTIGHNDGAIGVDDTSGEGRHLLIIANANPPEDCGRNYDYGGKLIDSFFMSVPFRTLTV